MTRADVKGFLYRWTQEAIARGNPDAFDTLLTEDVVDWSGPAPVRGAASFKARARAVHVAFADVRVQVDDWLVDGDAIAWRWTVTGTHTGLFAGLAATGRRTTLRGVNLQRLREGRVCEHFGLVDVFGAHQELLAP